MYFGVKSTIQKKLRGQVGTRITQDPITEVRISPRQNNKTKTFATDDGDSRNTVTHCSTV